VADYRGSSEGGAPKTQVIAQDNRFVPENIRINPGQMVVTRMPFGRTSIPNPSENPSAANLLAQ
jgi:hypothetical protein